MAHFLSDCRKSNSSASLLITFDFPVSLRWVMNDGLGKGSSVGRVRTRLGSDNRIGSLFR